MARWDFRRPTALVRQTKRVTIVARKDTSAVSVELLVEELEANKEAEKEEKTSRLARIAERRDTMRRIVGRKLVAKEAKEANLRRVKAKEKEMAKGTSALGSTRKSRPTRKLKKEKIFAALNELQDQRMKRLHRQHRMSRRD